MESNLLEMGSQFLRIIMDKDSDKIKFGQFKDMLIRSHK